MPGTQKFDEQGHHTYIVLNEVSHNPVNIMYYTDNMWTSMNKLPTQTNKEL